VQNKGEIAIHSVGSFHVCTTSEQLSFVVGEVGEVLILMNEEEVGLLVMLTEEVVVVAVEVVSVAFSFSVDSKLAKYNSKAAISSGEILEVEVEMSDMVVVDEAGLVVEGNLDVTGVVSVVEVSADVVILMVVDVVLQTTNPTGHI
jgi:hypothetical protein